MRTFVQLKDGVGFAVVNTPNETAGIEVELGTGEQYLNKFYDNNKWTDAPLIWFAEIGHDGSILEFKKTYFVSEIGNAPILTPDVKPSAKWLNGAWVNPPVVELFADPMVDSVQPVGETNIENAGDTV